MPTLQEQAIKMTKEAEGSLFRAARHVPEDKRDEWKPLGEARSVLSQLVECATVPYFFASVLAGAPMDLSSPEAQAKRRELEASITSVESAEAVSKKAHELLFKAIAEVPDSDLDAKRPMPWDPSTTAADVMFFAYWNLVYHIGQINYIQLMLGDTEMHP